MGTRGWLVTGIGVAIALWVIRIALIAAIVLAVAKLAGVF